MLRFTVPLLLAPFLASCQPPAIAVHAAFLGGALAFVPADPGDSDSVFCWGGGTVIDDALRPVWRFTGPRTGECGRLFPLYYGEAPEGALTAVPAAALEPGRLYLFIGSATAEVSGAFALSRAGRGRIVHNVDPDSPAAAALRTRWYRLTPPGETAAAPGQ